MVDLAYLAFLWRWNLAKEGLTKGEPRVYWALDRGCVRPAFWQACGAALRLTKDESWILWTCDTHQVWSLGLTNLACVAHVQCSCIHVVWGIPCTVFIVLCYSIRVTRGVIRTRDMVLLNTWHLWSGTYWTLGVMLLHTWHVWSGPYWRHGALAYMALMKWHYRRRGIVLLHTWHLWSGTYWRLGVVLLHTWHLYSGTYWRLGVILLHTFHSLWVAHTGDMMTCSSMCVTRCGWHVLET